MLNQYKKWIKENKDICGYGNCAEATQLMAKKFPELTRIRGHYYCVAWGERSHWWLVDENDNIIDPTANQFPSKGNGHYEPWDDSQPEPTGICPNCGIKVYNNQTCCSDSCYSAYAVYCMNP